MPPKPPMEVRRWPVSLRVTGEDKTPRLEGHAAVFNQLSDDFGGWREKIAPGAFKDALKGDVRALWNHQDDLVLGRTKSGTLELEEDATGLFFRIKLPDTGWMRDRLVSLKRGDVTGASFGFFTEKDEWTTEMNGTKIRTITKIKELLEVSPGVTFPAYPQTDVALASLRKWEAKSSRPAGPPANTGAGLDWYDRRLKLLARQL